MRVFVPVPQMQQEGLAGEMADHGGGLRRGEEADGGAVAEEAQVAVVGDDVDGAAAPGGLGLGGRGLAHADVVDGADVAAVEADAGAVLEHVLPGGVDGGGGPPEEGFGEGDGVVALLGEGEGVLVLAAWERRGFAFVVGWWRLLLKVKPVGRLVPVVVHAGEAEPCPQTHVPPGVVLGVDEVREGLADEGEADKVADVVEGDLVEDVGEEFAREGRDGAGGRGGVLDGGRRGLDEEVGEAGEEVLDGEDDGLC